MDDDRERTRDRSRDRYDDHRSRHDEDERMSRRRSRSRSPRSRSRSRSRSPVRRYRSRSRSRSRSPYRRDRGGRDRDYDYRERGDRGRDSYGTSSRRGGWRERGEPYDPTRKSAHREAAAQEAARRSRKDCRVYVGNLSFSVRWGELKDFMREAGRVVFAEIMQLSDGTSKGCGLVEYETPEEAQRAIRELNDRTLYGRQVFLREDREDEARYGAAAITPIGRGSRLPPTSRPVAPPSGENPHIFISGLAPNVGWQELKDLFKSAGNIIRADVKYGRDGQPNGMGTVTYEHPYEAQKSIDMYNGFEFHGQVLEVREDRFPGSIGRGGFRNPYAPPRPAFRERGERGGSSTSGGYHNDAATGDVAMGSVDMPTAPAAFGAGQNAASYVEPGSSVAPSNQVFVKNLPWSTATEDLFDLFGAIGTVEHAEVLSENGRSKGTGVVQYATIEDATAAVEQLNKYVYGNRALTVDFNANTKMNTVAEMRTD